jgi:hypothetical protein
MSAKRSLLTAALCLGLIFGIFQGASAQTGNVCLILAYEHDQTFSNSDCDSYTVGYGWVAVSPGLVEEFVKANSISAAFYGDNVKFGVSGEEAASLWLPMDTRPSEELGYYCPNPTGLVYRAKFRMDIGKLAPGTYNLFFLDTLSHPLNDGTASCVDDQGQHLPNIIYSGTFIDTYTDAITITP